MNRKPKTATPPQTALAAFEAHKAKILKMLAQLPAHVEMYDREISSTPGGHLDWSHAGTMGEVSKQVEAALQSVLDALVATRDRATARASRASYSGSVVLGDGRRVRVTVPTSKVRS